MSNLNPAQIELHQKLIASINNTQRHFDMSNWCVPGHNAEIATCGTASCLAGHLEALYPELAKKLRPYFVRSGGGFRHDRLAAEIYETVTGVECPLDFYATDYDESTEDTLSSITRDEAIAHINGEHPQWPLRDV